jgi:large subunit ribosomal protein L5
MQANPMRNIRIDKVTLNIGCGDDKVKIEKAKHLIEMLTGGKPVITRSKKRSTFGVTKDKPIGVKVTLRKKLAEEFLVKSIGAVGKKIRMGQIDADGNLNIGIKEYIDLPGVKYSHEVGMMGLGVCVTLERPGYRIKRRRIKQNIISKNHKLTKEEVANWLSQRYGVNVVQ